MRIHRLLLQDFRGVSRREIRFPETGVVVLAGANEVGKSSLVEALDLLLHERASSAKATVRAIQPVGSDVGSVVEAELTLGPVRLVYRKQWNRGAATQLDLLTPVREQLTGRPAHERMSSLLAEHLDADLYQAQRVLQSGRAGDRWAAAGSLTAALDDAAGRAVAQESGEDLVAAVEQEYRTLHTATGRPTGPWRELLQQHQDAVVAAETAGAALVEIDSRVAGHEAAQRRLELLAVDIAGDTATLADLRARRVAVLDLVAVLDRADLEAAATVQHRDGVDRVFRDRTAAVEGVAGLTAEIARVELESARLRTDLAPAEAEVVRCTAEVSLARERSVTAETAARQAQLEADRQADLAELRELRATVDAVDTADAAVTAARTELELLRVGPVEESRTERAHRKLELAVAAAETAAPRLGVELDHPEVVVALNGSTVTGLLDHPVTEDLTLDLPGVARISITPGAGAGELADRVRRAREELAAVLNELAVTDVAAAREQARRHRALSTEFDRAQARLLELTGRRSRQSMVDRCAALQVAIGTDAAAAVVDGDADRGRGADIDPVDHRAVARAAQQESIRCQDRWRAAAAGRDVAAALVHRLSQLLVGSEARALALTENRTLAGEALDRLRADEPDAEVSARVVQAQNAVDTARAAVVVARAEFEAVAEPGLDEAIRAAEATLAQRTRAHATAEKAQHALSTELEIIGAQGRQDQADLAESHLVGLTRRLAAVTARAAAVTLLRKTLHHHRDQARARYVAPFQQALVRLGRRWLGASFDVAVGEDLQVLTRSLHGTTVPVGVLSTGAAEQIAVLIRLATASLVGGTGGVPVVLDDALGFTDPDRLAGLGPAFSGLEDSQILLLTCDPDRYRAIPGATVLTLDRDTVTAVAPQPTAVPTPAVVPPRGRRPRPPERAELSLFDSDDLADDPELPLLLNPVRSTAERRLA